MQTLTQVWRPHIHDLITAPKKPSPNTITVGVRFQYVNFGVTHFVHSSRPRTKTPTPTYSPHTSQHDLDSGSWHDSLALARWRDQALPRFLLYHPLWLTFVLKLNSGTQGGCSRWAVARKWHSKQGGGKLCNFKSIIISSYWSFSSWKANSFSHVHSLCSSYSVKQFGKGNSLVLCI